MKQDRESVGVYWGTFDPPTKAHLHIIKSAIDTHQLTKLIVVINDDSKTKKEYKTSGVERKKMMSLVLPGDIRDKIDVRVQTDEKQISYSDLKSEFSKQRVIAVVGEDSFLKFGKGCAYCHHVSVMPRGEASEAINTVLKEYNLTNVTILPTQHELVNCSSTEVRELLVKTGEDVELLKMIYDLLAKHITICQLYIPQYQSSNSAYQQAHRDAAVVIQRGWRKHMLFAAENKHKDAADGKVIIKSPGT
jgi:nicotinic acid mononucleotide adenylyltransferase